MKTLLAVAATIIFTFVVGAQTPDSDAPRFGTGNELTRPENYREWIYLSSGLGMLYSPAAGASNSPNPAFDNVFVTPAAYRSFVKTGTWPDKTMFVLELRGSASEGSINAQGRFQGPLLGIEVEVKDESRFAGKWAFYNFGSSAVSTAPLPTTASCYACHAQHGAVDNTFVQFYPTLAEIARTKGTLRIMP